MVDKIITLNNQKKYLILDETTIDNKKYYFGIRLENNEPTNNYLYFEEIDNNNLKPIIDENLKEILLTSFTINYINKVYDEVK